MVQVKEVRTPAPVSRARECRVCFGPHDDEIHEATVSIREWLKEEVTRYLE